MYAQLELVVVRLYGMLLRAQQPETVSALPLEVPHLDAPLVDGSLQCVDALALAVDLLC